ncbi:MAG: choice-of-anchor E domain-containing protein [Pseudorhodoferax sp.]
MKKWMAIAGAALAVGSAQAATVSYSFANTLENTEISQTGSLGLFDTNLGTLTGASLSFGAELAGTIMLTLGDAQATTSVRGTTTSDIGINSSLAALDALFSGVSDLSLSYTTGFVALAPNSNYTSDLLNDSDSLLVDLGSILSSLGAAGGGSFDLSCESLSGLGITGGAGFSGGSQTTQGACNASIVYTYDSAPPPTNTVPEPAALSFFGLAALGFAAANRRRKIR